MPRHVFENEPMRTTIRLKRFHSRICTSSTWLERSQHKLLARAPTCRARPTRRCDRRFALFCVADRLPLA